MRRTLTPNRLKMIMKAAAKSALREARDPYVDLVLEEEDKAPEPEGGSEETPDVKLDVSKGPSAAVAYLNGPGADKRVRALLDAGRDDGSEDDEAAKVSEGSATIGELVPTQIEIELTKSIAYPLASFKSMKKMISGGVQKIGAPGNDTIVKSGNLIVDGHHRWSSLFSVAGPKGVIAAIDISLPEKDAASVLAIVQTAIAATTDGPVPKAKAGGMNILGKSKDELVKLITSAVGQSGEAGEILSDDYVSACLSDPVVSKHFGLAGSSKKEETKAESRRRGKLLEAQGESNEKIEQARKAIIEKVADNLSQMNQPAEGSPPRVDMPQLDKAGKGVQGVFDALKSGEVNYKAPFKAESKSRSGQVVVERWQRLAGIIKG